MKSSLTQSLARAISVCAGLESAAVEGMIAQPANPEHGDAAFPCFALAKVLKKAPQQCALELAGKIELPPGVSQVEAAGPYLNFRFDRGAFTAGVIIEAFAGPKIAAAAPQRVIVEYSSPNIAKPFHVGHLRATLIGNSLDRLYRYLGHQVTSINHLGDWGTQFGFVWAGCEMWGKPKNDSVIELLEIYRKATALKAQQDASPPAAGEPDVNRTARQFFIDLEEGKDYAIEFWKWCSKISLDYFKHTYDRLGVKFDHYTGESFYSEMLGEVRKTLEEAGILAASGGALGVDLGEQLGFARVFTPDGRSLYLTRDIATAEYRAKTFKFDRAIYVVGAPQTLHFQQIVGILKKLGRSYAEKIIHVAFGHVMGIKTRGEGQFIELNEFIDEAIARALDAYRTQVSKRPDGLDENAVAQAVALSAIIFANVSRTNIKDVHFSWEHALAFQGDSGPYLLYAYARINGIVAKASEEKIKSAKSPDGSLLTEQSAFQLASYISDLEKILEKTASENEPGILANYGLDLAKAVSKAYLDLKVVGESPDKAGARLALLEAARDTLGIVLRLLGITPLERM